MTENSKELLEKWDKILSIDMSNTKKLKLYRLLENIALYNQEDFKFLLLVSIKLIETIPDLKISSKKKKDGMVHLVDIEKESLYDDEDNFIVEYTKYLLNRIVKEIQEILKEEKKIYSIEIIKNVNIFSFYLVF